MVSVHCDHILLSQFINNNCVDEYFVETLTIINVVLCSASDDIVSTKENRPRNDFDEMISDELSGHHHINI